MPIGGNLVNLPTSLLPTLAGATPAGGLLLGIIGSNFNINLAIQALEVQGKARTLAEPKTVTVENAKATISRGFEVPFVSTPSQGLSQVQFKEALLKLEVTPRVIRDNGDTRIRMKVVFENNEPDFSGQRSVNGNPSIFKRRQETEVLVSQGQRLVVGGVTNDTSAMTTREVPVFGRIPVARLALQEPRDEQDRGGADRHPDADRARRGRGRAEVGGVRGLLAPRAGAVRGDARRAVPPARSEPSREPARTPHGDRARDGGHGPRRRRGDRQDRSCAARSAPSCPRTFAVCLVINPYLSGAELIGTILDDLGVARAGSTHGELMAALARHLLAVGAEGQSVVVIVDEAQQMSVEALEQIRILSTIEMPGRKLLQVVLVGHPELLDKLGRRELYQLDQRVGVRCRLEPLSARDTSRYVEHRLRVAGLVGALPFTRAALAELYRATRGIPRVINLVSDRALARAFAARAEEVTPVHVKGAVRDIAPRTRPPRWARARGTAWRDRAGEIVRWAAADAPSRRGRRGRRHRRAGRGRSRCPSLGQRAGLMGPAAHHGLCDAGLVAAADGPARDCADACASGGRHDGRRDTGRLAAARPSVRRLLGQARCPDHRRAHCRSRWRSRGASATRLVRARRRGHGRPAPTRGSVTGDLGCQGIPGRLDRGVAGAGRGARRRRRRGSPPAGGDAARSGRSGRPARH